MIKKALKIIGIILGLAIVGILGFFWKDAKFDKYNVSIDDSKIPIFKQIAFPFVHQYNSKKSLPIVASAMIDIDNDGIDEIFIGGGLGQDDKLFKIVNEKFIDITSQTAWQQKENLTTVAVATADFDNNGFQDLIISREDGLHLYMNDSIKFEHKPIRTDINAKSTPAGITLGDIDKDGDLDIFLSTYIKKELMEGQTIFEDKNYGSTSALLLNEGGNNFKNITVEAGLDYIHNTFMTILIDVDDDSDLDLVVAHDTGEVRTYKNNGNKTYTMVPNPTTNKFAYPMGIAVGDYNNDSKVDFAFSNTGSTLPRFMAKGDIKDASKFNEKYILFKNEGNFKFSDAAEETKIANYEFAWGLVFADMNNDGLQDLMVAENYVDLAPNKLFRLPSRMLIQKEDHTFVPTEKKSGVKNPYFAITPLIGDINNDGFLDMIWVNINTPSIVYINQYKTGNFVKLLLPKNAKNIGAIITLTLENGKQLTEHLITGEGLASDQSAMIHFGIGTEKSVKNISIKFLDGTIKTINNPEINKTIKWLE